MSMESIANLCRICVSESYFYSNIYDQNEMENSRLFEAINDVCQLDITEDDGLPQYICAQCERKLSEFRLFKKQSHKSKLILYSMKEKKRKVSQVEHSVRPKLEEEDDHGGIVAEEDYETPQKQALLCAEDRADSALPDAKEVDDVRPYDEAPNEVFIKMEPKEDEVVTEEPTYSNPMETYGGDRLGGSSSALPPQEENVVSDARGPPEQYFVRRPGGYRRPTPQKFGVPLEFQEEITAVGNSSEDQIVSVVRRIPIHQLHKKEGSSKDGRRRCRVCYRNISQRDGKKVADVRAKKVTTYCGDCEGRPPMCIKCFNDVHPKYNSYNQDFNMEEVSTNLSDDHFTDEEGVDVKPDLCSIDPEDGSGGHVGRPSRAKRRTTVERRSAAVVPSNGILNQDCNSGAILKDYGVNAVHRGDDGPLEMGAVDDYAPYDNDMDHASYSDRDEAFSNSRNDNSKKATPHLIPMNVSTSARPARILEKKASYTRGKRKRVVLSIETKLRIIERIKNGEKVTKLASEYMIGIQTVRDIYRKEEELMTYVQSSPAYVSRKTTKGSTFEKLERAIFKWFQLENAGGKLVSSMELTEKALVLQKQFGFEGNFTASPSWLYRFKARYGIRKLSKNKEAS